MCVQKVAIQGNLLLRNKRPGAIVKLFFKSRPIRNFFCHYFRSDFRTVVRCQVRDCPPVEGEVCTAAAAAAAAVAVSRNATTLRQEEEEEEEVEGSLLRTAEFEDESAVCADPLMRRYCIHPEYRVRCCKSCQGEEMFL